MDLAGDQPPQDSVSEPLVESDLLGHAFVRAREARDKLTRDQVMSAMYGDQRVRRMLSHISMDMRLQDDVEEALQRVALMFFSDFLDKVLSNGTEPQGVYRLVYAIALNAFRSIRKERLREANRTAVYDENPEGEGDGFVAQSEQLLEDPFPLLDRKIDMDRAQQELSRRIQAAAKVPLGDRASIERICPGVVIGTPVSPKAPVRRRRRSLTTECAKELTSIKAALAITNSEFAEALGIGLPTLASYIYGRVQSVPDSVMEAARQMRSSASPAAIQTRGWLESTPMPEIVASWVRKMGLQKLALQEADQRISDLLECNPITVWRWRTGGAKPKVAVLMVYQDKVDAQSKPRGRQRRSH